MEKTHRDLRRLPFKLTNKSTIHPRQNKEQGFSGSLAQWGCSGPVTFSSHTGRLCTCYFLADTQEYWALNKLHTPRMLLILLSPFMTLSVVVVVIWKSEPKKDGEIRGSNNNTHLSLCGIKRRSVFQGLSDAFDHMTSMVLILRHTHTKKNILAAVASHKMTMWWQSCKIKNLTGLVYNETVTGAVVRCVFLNAVILMHAACLPLEWVGQLILFSWIFLPVSIFDIPYFWKSNGTGFPEWSGCSAHNSRSALKSPGTAIKVLLHSWSLAI